jgi:hypothetical protein
MLDKQEPKRVSILGVGRCMPLISTVIARALALIDAFSSAFIATSVTVDNSTNCCYPQTNITATYTPLGQDVLSLIKLVMVDTPLSIIPFWLPALKEAVAGLMTVSASTLP